MLNFLHITFVLLKHAHEVHVHSYAPVKSEKKNEDLN